MSVPLTAACDPEPTIGAGQLESWPGSQKASDGAGWGVGLGEEPDTRPTRKLTCDFRAACLAGALFWLLGFQQYLRSHPFLWSSDVFETLLILH